MTRDLVFEIGTEELPSKPLYGAIEQLGVAVPKALDGARLEYDSVRVLGSPRRLIVAVSGLAERQADAVHNHKGPAAKAAFGEDGSPTPAAMGFARGKGVAVESLQVIEDSNGAYVWATVEETGTDASAVLPDLLAGLAANIDWPKSQRWGSGDARFSRPVRWLLALFGDEVVPVRFAGLEAARITFGHRFLAPGPLEVQTAADLESVLIGSNVTADHGARAGLLREGIEAAAAQLGAHAVVPEKTFAEVVNLVEWPTVAVGTFDEAFLDVPREILENAMGSHQRYFPVESADGCLTNRFIVAHNGDPARSEAIVAGHQRVIRARLSDAAFFYREDLARPLEAYVSRLDSIVFQDKLGSLGDKVRRVGSLSEAIAQLVGAPADQASFAIRAAHLCKADLVTSAVVEFTDLQGVMGSYYAVASGEEPGVAQAIVEHYRPRFAGDDVPSTVAGSIVAVADKLDTIAGIFAVGMAPTGSADPYALRRSAIGILQILLGGTHARLDELISAALAGYDGVLEFDRDAVGQAIREFFAARLENILRDRGHAYDTVAAVLASAAVEPWDALARCEALTAFRAASNDMEDLSTAFTRARNLSRPDLQGDADRALMGAEELQLADALDAAGASADEYLAAGAYGALLESYAGLRAPIDAFFETVLVMDPDDAIRENRLRLLNRFVALFGRFGDFGALSS
ncbi:MAG: glycine--tRNA ligase subunit beta [Coriobacteriia bacterium]|nr:glycine--tRNA ligase subunit beta [Coriobacteriia bacterium]